MTHVDFDEILYAQDRGWFAHFQKTVNRKYDCGIKIKNLRLVVTIRRSVCLIMNAARRAPRNYAGIHEY